MTKVMNITTLQKDLCNNVVLDGKKYLVLTENLSKEYLITTRIYLGGTIISVRKVDYKNIMNTPDPERKITELMQKAHEQALTMLGMEKIKEEETFVYYLNKLLKRKKYESALKLVTTALEQYPDEPILLSYYGYLDALVNKNYTYGINTCIKAREIIIDKVPFGREFFNPVLYLNLGRAYLAAGNKEDAIETFHAGLIFDNENEDLLSEIRNLGKRRTHVIPFLKRSHPVNKYIGKLLHNLYKLRRS